MTDLSPAAQAVMDAFWKDLDFREDFTPRNIAAALRAAADQVVPELGRPRTADERTLYSELNWNVYVTYFLSAHEGRLDAVIRHRKHLLAIAAELEGRNEATL
jgi:hypothetical protein